MIIIIIKNGKKKKSQFMFCFVFWEELQRVVFLPKRAAFKSPS